MTDSSKPSLRFHPTKELYHRLVAMLDKIEAAPDATVHRAKLAEIVNELNAAGQHAYFLRPLKAAKVGHLTQQTASIGIAGVQHMMAPFIRGVIGRLEHAQLQAVAQAIREFML